MSLDFPQCVLVGGSGIESLNGLYSRMKNIVYMGEKQREKPCYMMEGTGYSIESGSWTSRPMYLYWLQGKWKLGTTLDSHESFAFSIGEKQHLCHSGRTWMVWNHGTKEHNAAPASMQVSQTKAITADKNIALRTGDNELPMNAAATTSGSSNFEDEEDGCRSLKKGLPASKCTTSAEQHCYPVATELAQAEQKFENRLRCALSAVPNLRQQQKMLDVANAKLLSQQLDLGIMQPEHMRSVIERVQEDFGTKRGFGTKTFEGAPSPKKVRGPAGEPMTPQDNLARSPSSPSNSMSPAVKPSAPPKLPSSPNMLGGVIVAGNTVILQGLQTRVDLEGKLGSVQSIDVAAQRWIVKVESSGEEVRVLLKNLKLSAPTSPTLKPVSPKTKPASPPVSPRMRPSIPKVLDISVRERVT